MIKLVKQLIKIKRLFNASKKFNKLLSMHFSKMPVLLADININGFHKEFEECVHNILMFEGVIKSFKQLYDESDNEARDKIADTIIVLDEALNGYAQSLNSYMSVREKLLSGPCKITLLVERIDET